MQGMTSEWCTIQSDPGVFTELIQKIGVKGTQVEEVISLDQQQLQKIEPIYGLVFLFKWKASPQPRKCVDSIPYDMFFANQVLTNSCATQAILSILLNNFQIDIGDTLSDLKAFTIDMDPKQKGQTIGNSDTIRQAHNSFSKQQYFSIYEKRAAKQDDDVFHFISYIPFQGKLYELDGLQKGPIELGDIHNGNWLTLAQTCIQERIQKYAAEELRFNLMAIVGNQVQKYQRLVATSNSKIQYAKKLLGQEVNEVQIVLDQTEIKSIPAQIELIDTYILQMEEQLSIQKQFLFEQQQKRKNWQTENVRRKHNYIPLAFQFLKALAKTGQLRTMFKEACQQEQKQKNK